MEPMPTLSQIEQALRDSWAADTCDPVDIVDWSAANPARGQCGVTALVLQELLGGELVLGQVHYPDGSRQGVHYWNRLGTVEIDLTRDQFTAGERISGATTVRPDGPPRRCREQYERLRSRVNAALEVTT
jgi:hypothetical protein